MAYRQSKAFKAFLASGVPLTGYLGYWQYSRWGWKLDLIEKTETRPKMEPIVGLPQTWQVGSIHDVPEDYVYRRLVLKGKYRHDKEVFIFPRPMIRPSKDKDGNLHKLEEFSSSEKKSKLAEGKLGGYIVTPFETNDGRSILVNRGYVSLDYLPAERRSGGQLDFEHTISGILRDTESDNDQINFVPFIEEVDTKFAAIEKRNTTALADYTNSLPVYIDLDREAAHPEGPIGGQCKLTLPNNHAAYMVQWWGLCSFITYWLCTNL